MEVVEVDGDVEGVENVEQDAIADQTSHDGDSSAEKVEVELEVVKSDRYLVSLLYQTKDFEDTSDWMNVAVATVKMIWFFRRRSEEKNLECENDQSP